ncbi:MAG TPA: MlaD family protein [Spirochaetia bacterium]|nr:MlaD family protein [Spirochaetia bacterium]
MAVRASRIVRVVFIIVVALAASLLLYLLINNFQFVPGHSVRIHFSSIGDLNNGSFVRRAGVKVGSVTKIEPAPDERSSIVTITFESGKSARDGDQFALVSKGILGDMYIEQRRGAQDAPPVEDGHLFEGIPAFNITDLLTGDTMGMVTDLADSLKGIVQILKNNQDTLDQSLKDIAKTAHNVRVVTDRAVEVTSDVPDITRQITSSVDQLQAAVTDVSTTTQRLMAKLEGNLTTSSDDLAASMKAIRSSSEAIQASVQKLTAQNSVISTMGSADTARSLETTVKNLQEVSQNLLTVTKDTQKIVNGVSSIFDQK